MNSSSFTFKTCARETSVSCPARDNQRKYDFSDARAEESGKRDSEQNAGKRQERVDEQKIYEAIKPSAKKTREHTDSKARRATSENN